MGGFQAFSIGGIPVHFTLWYFFILLYWMRGGAQSGLTWGLVITFSILVHEFGHALVARYFRLSPWVELHGWGGLTHHDRAARDRDDALIIVALFMLVYYLFADIVVLLVAVAAPATIMFLPNLLGP